MRLVEMISGAIMTYAAAKRRSKFFLIFTVISALLVAKPVKVSALLLLPGFNNEAQALLYLQNLEKSYSTKCNEVMTVRWNYVTNVTAETEKASSEAETEYMKFQAEVQKEILDQFPNWKEFNNDETKRQFKYLSIAGPATMPPEDVAKMSELGGKMESDYSTAAVCSYEDPENCTCRLDPEIETVFRTERDPKILAHYWTAWHDKMSELVPPSKYQEFLEYQSEMAKANGFQDMSEMWMTSYDDGSPEWTSDKFKQDILAIWEDIRPMYETLHAYVRMKLRKIPEYEGLIEKDGCIPAYLTGNMWAQSWGQLEDVTKPFPEAPSLDATEAMIQKNYNVLTMFQEADKFFTDLGLYPMTSTFWEKSMFERPDDGREVVCHASAADFCLGRGNTDFRIKQCAKVNMGQLFTAHHEMGHVQYYQQYTNLDIVFRDGANPGFHEAIGDALALAVVTPKHLQCVLQLDLKLDSQICLPQKPAAAEISEMDINYLYQAALKKLAFFPFAISMDSWRWEAFEGKLSPDQYNARWWELRQQNQGISPANDRSNPNLFDPAAKYHIVSNVEYLRYFVSHILQFQFYEAMCTAAGHYDPKNPESQPLYQCDFAGSKDAGKLLGDMMKLGFSKGWPIALQKITGSPQMSISSMKNYFQPILDFMAKELDSEGEVVGFVCAGPQEAPAEEAPVEEPPAKEAPAEEAPAEEAPAEEAPAEEVPAE